VVGLGNPGRRYSGSRHNIGFTLVKRLCQEKSVKLKRKKYLAKAAVVEIAGEKTFVVIPQTYMNRSGMAVKKIVEEIGIHPENLVIVYDDLDIPLGDIRIRKKGSAGSHNGIDSIIKEIGTTVFPRIRIGIGPHKGDDDRADFVLSPFSADEMPLVENGLAKAREALEIILAGDVQKAMNVYNSRLSAEEERILE
jgi:PTH1 family peptidyl-tRNA hydrolase